jgi:glycosyltransferase involved in cell wall biosynthesis
LQSGVTVHEIPGGFSLAGLRWLGRSLRQFAHPKTLLVQYVYNAYGYRGMNLPFCTWLLSRNWLWRDDVRIMFHEPYYSFGRQSLRRNALAGVTHVMAALMLAAGRTVYVSAAAWEPLLMPWNLLRRRMTWLPIPSTIPGAPPDAHAIYREYSSTIGHFGTYGGPIREPLLSVLAGILAQQPDVHLKLLGAGGKQFAAELVQRAPAAAPNVTAFDRLPDEEVARHIRSCDVMLQYYPDGVSTRRTSVMACLANGVPVVTTTGWLSEPVWDLDAAVALAPADNLAAIVAVTTNLLADKAARIKLAREGFEFYQRRFSLSRTLGVLLNEPAAAP